MNKESDSTSTTKKVAFSRFNQQAFIDKNLKHFVEARRKKQSEDKGGNRG